MTLTDIVAKVADLIGDVDALTQTQHTNNNGTISYLVCAGCLYERNFVEELSDMWRGTTQAYTFDDEVPYVANSRNRCDLVVEDAKKDDSWAIEVKRIQMFGDNGKKNDFGIGKIVSPYLHERSSVLDAIRLQNAQLKMSDTKTITPTKKAIVMYGFEFGPDTADTATEISERLGLDETRVLNFEKSFKLMVADPKNDEISLTKLIPLFEAACTTEGIQLGPCVQRTFDFSKTSRHPLLYRGRILGWEVL